MGLSVLWLVLFVGSSAYALGRVDRERPAPPPPPPVPYPGSAIADAARTLAAAERRRHPVT